MAMDNHHHLALIRRSRRTIPSWQSVSKTTTLLSSSSSSFSFIFVIIIVIFFSSSSSSSVSAELPDDYAVFKIQQKGACSTVYCPWYCERYIDANGCVYCGKCNKPFPYKCPPITCPNFPHFECVARAGRDGCNVCKCRQRIAPPPPPPPSVVDRGGPPPCPPSPMCGRYCRLEKDTRGCERCSCPTTALTAPRKDCPEAADAPCPRNDCWRERGADGCYNCRCHDDVAVCPEVKCDFSKCQHVIDANTGCATGCQCNRNDV